MPNPADVFPGWERLESDLSAAADAGDDVKLSAVEVLTLLGEVQRLGRRLDGAARLLRQVTDGRGCWASEQGYLPCAFRGVDGFLAELPKRRWWWRR
ncbi:hypothetical protein [Catenulispora pinisilvae]|uniref:hypothetical protein n=1 Tax=Catenulispora pinisilvae TaxID=2705253 RepID=UPI00189141D3|nr:hypothetical protein [Catenulispora pinisilvae]